MKCEKCQNDYPSQYYFAAPNICRECYGKLSPEEQMHYQNIINSYYQSQPFVYRQGFGIRLLAYILDGILVGVLMIAAFYVNGTFEKIMTYGANILSDAAIMTDLIKSITPLSAIIGLMYFSLEVIFAASPGKMILGLRIGTQDRNEATTTTLLIRFLLKESSTVLSAIALIPGLFFVPYIGSFCNIFIIVGFFWTLTQKKQSFHDMLSKTAVYKKADIINE